VPGLTQTLQRSEISAATNIAQPGEEKRLEGVLDAITDVRIESLGAPQQEHATRMRTVFQQKNVVGIGITEKVSRGQSTGRMAVAFYVVKKLPKNQLSDSTMVPPTVPGPLVAGADVPTDVIELGKIKLHTVPFIQRTPIQPGNSVGHFKASAGTLGAIVRRGEKRMILSNSHVLARSGKGKKGDAILYPGKADKGHRPGDVIAKLNKFTKFKTGGDYVNELDCAVAVLATGAKARPVNHCIRGLVAPKGIAAPKRKMKVQIAGRTTGVSTTPTTIVDTHFRFEVLYPDLGKSVGFKDQILCRPPYAQNGDSGALVVERKTGRAVGLHFAGTSKGSVSCPIAKVLKSMDVTLDLFEG
jgi:hypothetical protein